MREGKKDRKAERKIKRVVILRQRERERKKQEIKD